MQVVIEMDPKEPRKKRTLWRSFNTRDYMEEHICRISHSAVWHRQPDECLTQSERGQESSLKAENRNCALRSFSDGFRFLAVQRDSRIWDYMEENDIAANPRPVHHRIPNFVNAELTAKQVLLA